MQITVYEQWREIENIRSFYFDRWIATKSKRDYMTWLKWTMKERNARKIIVAHLFERVP